MWDWLRSFFDVATLSPHGICLLWRPELVWTHAISDTLIGLAYFSIPLALGAFLYARRDVRFGWAVWLFVLFIMLCGLTHFMMVWTLWKPHYGIEAVLKAATAAASLVTAIALWPLLPRAIAIPSAAVLQDRIAERDRALAELQQAMTTMVQMEEHQQEQARLLEEVNRSEARLRSIFENAAVGIARVGIDGEFLEVNDRFVEIAGWPRATLLASGFAQITLPDDLPADLANVEALLRGDIDSYTLDKRYVRQDGGIVWVRLTGSIVRTDQGAPDHFVAIVDDITHHKRMQEARDLLMREVDHRARNALTVVQSVVRLTDAEDPGVYKDKVIGRIEALARAQSALARANWSGALLEEVVAHEVASATDPERFWTAGPPIALAPEQVQPLSMILHELATNAAKYGALSAPNGRVKVTWQTHGSEWRLRWQEAGGPAVGPPERQGFGSRLVRNLAAQLGGRIQTTWSAQGVLVDLLAQGPAPSATGDHPFIGAPIPGPSGLGRS